MSETILVVDDEENIRHTLRGVLADEGFEVLEAPDGRRALELLRHAAPRLAIVDVWMPEMDGIELVERMRNQAPGVPIIVISGHGTIETAVRVIRLGAFDFLEKPFPLDALLSVVGRALGSAPAPGASADGSGAPATAIAPARHFPQRTIGRSVLVNGQGLHSGARTGLILQPLPPGDRKSTRLNSSHSQISYAVFCLKKKQTSRILPEIHRLVFWNSFPWPGCR